MGYHVSMDVKAKIPSENVEKCLQTINAMYSEDDSLLSSMYNNGDVPITAFAADKWGEDLKFFKTIAPFVESGGFIHIRGKDGEEWGYEFADGKVYELKCQKQWIRGDVLR